jgi:hypothetical protein
LAPFFRNANYDALSLFCESFIYFIACVNTAVRVLLEKYQRVDWLNGKNTFLGGGHAVMIPFQLTPRL